MQSHVTVIPSDFFLSVDGEGMVFEFPGPDGVHAIQWHDGSGHVEYTDGSPNAALTSADYQSKVAPYVALWQAEKDRREEEANRPPTLEEARAAKLAQVMDAYQAAFAPIEAVYPSAEREGWPIQEAEARALLADPQADAATVAPVLSALVQLRARGETPADLAQKVLANAGQWRMVYAWFTGQQQRMYGEVSGLATVAEIEAYPVEYQLPEGM